MMEIKLLYQTYYFDGYTDPAVMFIWSTMKAGILEPLAANCLTAVSSLNSRTSGEINLQFRDGSVRRLPIFKVVKSVIIYTPYNK